MRILNFLLVICCSWTVLWAQNVQEYMNVNTDRDVYLTGETLHLQIRVTDNQGTPSDMSKVAYVEISDTSRPHVQFMVALENGEGCADVILPHSMHSGAFELSVYTNYMRNFGPACFYRRNIGVANIGYSSAEDYIKWVESSPQESHSFEAGVQTDKKTYDRRERVQIRLPQDFLGNASLAVYRRDLEADGISFSPIRQDYRTVPGSEFLPEMEGHLLKAECLRETELTDVTLSVLGFTPRIFDGKNDGKGRFSFFTHGLSGNRQIALSGFDKNGNVVSLEPASPYAQSLPKDLPQLCLKFEEALLTQRYLGMQMQEHERADAFEKQTQEFRLQDRSPSYVYNLAEYTPMGTIREALTEFIEGIKLYQTAGKPSLHTTMEEETGYNKGPAFVLLDGIPVSSIKTLLDYDARLIHYILIYRGKCTFGNQVRDGVISFQTYQGTMPGYPLKNECLYSYAFPQTGSSFSGPEYGDIISRQSIRPDYRTLLYWNPSVKGDSVSFYASDLGGKYTVVVKSCDGKETWKGEFEVRED